MEKEEREKIKKERKKNTLTFILTGERAATRERDRKKRGREIDGVIDG